MPNTPEMVERVARALCRADGRPGKPEAEIDKLWFAWQGPARAAITAMREPTEAMCEAAGDTYEPHSCQDCFKIQWEAAIDEALHGPAPAQGIE